MKTIGEILQRVKITQEDTGNAPQAVTSAGLCAPGCEICGGVGYFRRDVDYGHPDFGRLTMCPNVDRWKLPSAARIGITRNEAETLAWSRIKKPAGVTGLERAVSAVQATLARGYGWVYLYGSYGIGKTLILQVATAEALRSGMEASYTRLDQILRNLRDTFDPRTGESESGRLEWWSSIEFLAIDEFDKIKATEYANERRFSLMDTRYLAACRERTVTVVASNEPPAALPGWLADRVLDGRFYAVEIKGPSQRPGMEW